MNDSITRAIAALQSGHDPFRLGHRQHHEEPNGDAALIELGARWEKINTGYHDACNRFSVAEGAAREGTEAGDSRGRSRRRISER